MIVNDSDFSEIFGEKENENLSSTEYMMRYCRSKNYNFQLLLNDLFFQNEPQLETYMNNQDEPTVESILDFNSREMDVLKIMLTLGE